jgi:hypothetical protein
MKIRKIAQVYAFGLHERLSSFVHDYKVKLVVNYDRKPSVSQVVRESRGPFLRRLSAPAMIATKSDLKTK